MSPIEPTPAPRPLEFQRMFAQVQAGIFGASEPVRVGRYVLRGRLGVGGMGVVYAADDADLGRRVAIKLLHGTGSQDQARGRILREAQALARLTHPNVVQIYEVGEVGRQVFVAMEFVEGLTLAQWQRQQTRPWRELLEVYVQAGRGLAAAHEAGLVHRDFKPENVLVGADGRVRVLDFGLARVASAAPFDPRHPTGDALLQPITVITATGAMLGTALYMSPEQWQAQATDARSDQFSFCVALYSAVHGAAPFPARDGPSLRAQVLAGVVAAPERVRVPGRLHRALLRGLRVDPRGRFPDMHALLAELEGVRRGRPLAWLGLGVLALGVGAALGGRWSAPEEPVPADMCAGGAARAEAVWGPTRKAAVRRAFLATGRSEAGELWTQVAAQLDAYALAWVHGHESACHAAQAGETSAGPQGELTEGPYLTMACLDRSLGELRALTDAFIADADAVIGNAVKAAYKLRPLEECRARPVLALLTTPPADPTTAVQVQALASRLDEISALLKAGEVGRGIARAREAAAQARALAHDHTTAEALVLLGSFESLAGEYGAAERSLFDAALLAERGDNRAALARARTELVFVVGYGLRRFDEGLRWGELAGNTMHSLGPGGALEVRLRSARGLVHRARGDLPSARAELVEALALAEATLGPDNPGVATALINLAGVQAEAGERSAARQSLRRALTIRARTLGVDHPDTRRTADEVVALDAEPSR